MQRLKEFQEGMSSDEIEVKLQYVSQLVDIAKEIGKAETISSLIPFLNDWCPDNDDEALTKLAVEIYKLNTVFEASEMKCVLPILKHLAKTEEVVVRDAAVDSINKIVDDMPATVVREELISLIEELYHDEWFTPRVSCCSLIAKTYQKITSLNGTEDVFESLKTLRECFFGLCKDDTPMVRRAAAKNLSAVLAACEDDCVSAFVTQFEDFFNSDDEAIKLTLMSVTKELLTRCKEETDKKTILTIFQNNLEARSYKIREAAALEIGSLASIMGQEAFSTVLLEPFLKLFKDSYVDVKNNAIKQMPALAKCLSKETFTQQVFPFLTTLSSDKTAMITEVIANVIIDLSSIYPDIVEPIIRVSLEDPSPQVRLIYLQRLDEIQLNETLINRLVLDEALEGPAWRIREEIAKHMSCLLKATENTPQQQALLNIYLGLFVDGVSKVRVTCRVALPQIIKELGSDFVFSKIIPSIEKKYNETNNYLLQFNFLYTYQVIIQEIPTDERISNMYKTILNEMNNSIPNLRFISCRILTALADLLPEDVKTKAITKMKELEGDSDRDVRYYATLGLKKLNP